MLVSITSAVIATVAILATTFLFWFLNERQRRSRLPPGPWGLPVVGVLPWLDAVNPHYTLTDLAKRYGPLYSAQLGDILTLVASDPTIVRAALARPELSGRAPLYLTHGLMEGKGLICAEGLLWKEQRRFVLSTLRTLGSSKTSSSVRKERLEKRVQAGVQRCLEALLLTSGSPVDPHSILTDALGNVVNDVVFGQTWDTNDPTWAWLRRLQDEGTRLIGVAGALNFLPFLRFLPKFQRTIKFLKSGQLEQHALYRQMVRGRHERLQHTSSNVVDNFIDAFLEAASSGPEDVYSETQLIYLLADLFGAGLDTTVTTLRWFLLIMAAYPEHQETVRRELMSLGGRHPTYEDFAALPFTQAAIAEVQRLRPVTPLGIPHGVVEDVEINGFLVPKGSMFIPLLWAIHLDPNRWNAPERYDPSRFIGSDGGFMRPDGFMPFQTGKRMCVGDEWARVMLFLFGASIVQKFKITIEPGKEISLEGEVGITLTPKEHKLIFTPVLE